MLLLLQLKSHEMIPDTHTPHPVLCALVGLKLLYIPGEHKNKEKKRNANSDWFT